MAMPNEPTLTYVRLARRQRELVDEMQRFYLLDSRSEVIRLAIEQLGKTFRQSPSVHTMLRERIIRRRQRRMAAR